MTDEDDFVTVARYLDATDAHLMCSCLQAAGLDAMLGDAHLVQTNGLWAIALGGVRVRVPQSQVAHAQDVIAAFERGDLALKDDFDGEEALNQGERP
jgi:hypothetical protein